MVTRTCEEHEEAENVEAEVPAGRQKRARKPNPNIFNKDFESTDHVGHSFLQSEFEDLSEDLKVEFLMHAINEFKATGDTKLVYRYCTGVVFMQMSAKAGLRKHGVDTEKALMREFMQLMDMDVMDPQKANELTAKQKQEALGMLNMIKEKRNHTPEVPDLKGRACVDGRPQKTRYTKEETASPTMSNDAFMI